MNTDNLDTNIVDKRGEHSKEQLEETSKIIFDSYEENIKKRIEGLYKQLGDRAKQGAVYEALKEQFAKSLEEKLDYATTNITEAEDVSPILLDISTQIKNNIFDGPAARPHKIPENIGINPGQKLNSYIKTIEEQGANLRDGELKAIENSLRLISMNAQRGLLKYGTTKQLYTTVSLFQTLVQSNHKFNPKSAGFIELMDMLESTAASIQLDFNTKPNYKYARPAYKQRLNNTLEILKELSLAHAEFYLNHKEE